MHSPLEQNVRSLVRERRISNFGTRKIDDFVSTFKERVEESRTLYVPISSPSGDTRTVKKTIRTEIIGESGRKHGIFSDKEHFEEKDGKSIKRIEATYVLDGKIVKADIRYDVTELVKAGAKTWEIPTVDFVLNSDGTMAYASRQYNNNIDEYRRKTGYGKGKDREEVIGRYKLWDFMQGRQRDETKRIFMESKNGFHVVREINVPFFLPLGLHCKNSNMTNVAISFCFQDGMLFYGAINNSALSNREWSRVWHTISTRKMIRFRLIRPFRMRNEEARSKTGAKWAFPLLAAGLAGSGARKKGGAPSREPTSSIRPKPGQNRAHGRPDVTRIAAKGSGSEAEQRVSERLRGGALAPGMHGRIAVTGQAARAIERITAKNARTERAEARIAEPRLDEKRARQRIIERIKAKALESIRAAIASRARNVQVIRAIYLSKARNPVMALDVARLAIMHRGMTKAKNIVPVPAAAHRLKATARSRIMVYANAIGPAKAAGNISENVKKASPAIGGLLVYLENELRMVEERIMRGISAMMFRIFSYITFGIRNYAEIRKVSYYPYVKSL